MKLNYHKKIMYDYKYSNHSSLYQEVEEVQKIEKENKRNEKGFRSIKKIRSKRESFAKVLSNRIFRNIIN